MTRVLLAPDKFKGTLTAAEVAAHLASGISSSAPDVEVSVVPVADGGDGTVEAAVAAGYEERTSRAHGPTGAERDARWARREGTAVVEMAEVSGLSQLPGGVLAPLDASSRGTGEVIVAALDAGARTIVLAIGGSASTDGGAGMLSALGARLTGADGAQVPDGGGGLAEAQRLDLSGLDARLRECDVVVACDVDNPLLGPDGAAAVYGPQKGATPEDVDALDAALARWAALVEQAVPGGSTDPATPGAGAAGGVGFAALAVLDARMRPGIDLVLDLVGFHEALDGADLVVTGEGRLDEQTLSGKAPAGVAAAAAAAGSTTVAVCGRLDLDEAALRAAGISAAWALTDVSDDLEECMTRPGPLLHRIGARIAEALPGLVADRAAAREH